MPSTFRYALLILMLALTAEAVSGQVTTGIPPFGRVDGSSGPDVIDLANLNTHIPIPMLRKAGRGTDFTYDLSYDSSVWFPVTSGGITSWQPVNNWGWHAQTEVATGYISYDKVLSSQPKCIYWTYQNFVYHDPWGASHPFPGSADSYSGSNPGLCGADFFAGLSSTAFDGSGYSIVLPSNTTGAFPGGTLYGRDGKVYTVPFNTGTGSSAFNDSNGNEITVSGSNFYDTLSSTNAVLTVSGSGTPTDPMKFTYTAPAGPAHYTVNYTNYTVATNFGITGKGEFKSSAPVPLVTSIVLPDNSQYTIQYESTPSTPAAGACTPYAGTTCRTARISSITLPTGGSITYTYTGVSNGVFGDGSTAGLQRQIYDGTNTNTWTYSRSGTLPATTTTIMDPQGNQTVSNFSGLYETQRQVFQGTSTLLETLLTCYNNNFSNCATATVAAPITKRDVYTTLPNLANPALSETTYNSFGQLTEDKEIDFVPNTNGSPYLSDTTITYDALTSTSSAIQVTTVKNNAGTIVSQTSIGFDETSATPTSGTPQHTSPTGARGNPTTITYVVGGSTTLKKTFTYYDTGNVLTATDVNGAQTTFTYGACGNSFPTLISEPLGLSQTLTWDCTGGVRKSVNDENGWAVTTGWADNYFWRPNSVTDQTGFFSNLWYNAQLAFEVYAPFSSNSAVDSLSIFDGLGRTSLSQKKQSQSSNTYDTVETDYDSLGRPSRVTMPYAGSWGQTNSSGPSTTTTYDALNRPHVTTDAGQGTVTRLYPENDVLVTIGPKTIGENLKSRQLEYDALGRLTSVCEITAGTTGWPGGPCGQNSSATGYWTRYRYDALGNLTGVCQNTTQPTSVDCVANPSSGQQTRTYSYDALSRLTSETNPESGTTTYLYDVVPGGCANAGAASGGDLTKVVDTAGHYVCTFYDALHRPTDIGSDRSGTACTRYRYDNTTGVLGSIPSGVSVSNTKGRLAEAETDACTWPITQSSIISDEWFSYTKRGETSDVYESTPHSAGYYHSSTSYYANGAPQTVSGPAPYFMNYNVDGEGRISSSTGSGNFLSGTTYNNASQITQINYASGDSDAYTYDPNTGRMTKYQFNVGSQSVVGTPTWNANGTLGSLSITDPFNSSNAQTCTYVHDDLLRIGGSSTVPGVNCVNGSQQTVWTNNFTYDAFGNINKSGTSSFNASYSAATNRMTQIASSTPTYDADGNVTNDFLHTYAWDGYGRPVTIDGVGVTYDALGRMVEQNRSGTYSQIAYSTTGEKLEIMSGQSYQKQYVRLVGGAEVVIPSVGTAFYSHPDWLGSARLASTSSRAVLGDVAYSPYGETYASSGAPFVSFTGMNQDTTANDYDFPAREYGIQGRWPSPDPAGLLAVDPSDPQSWNRYAYVDNNPLSFIDPTGLFLCGTECAPVPDPIPIGNDPFFNGNGAPNGGLCIKLHIRRMGLSLSQAQEACGVSQPPPLQPPTPKSPACTAAQQAAAALATAFDNASQTTGWIAFAGGVGTVGAGAGEGFTFGGDTAVTVTFGSVTSFFGTASLVTGGLSSSLNSFARGNMAAIRDFNSSQAANIIAKAAASRIPLIARWGDTIGDLTGRAVDLAKTAKEACHP